MSTLYIPAGVHKELHLHMHTCMVPWNYLVYLILTVYTDLFVFRVVQVFRRVQVDPVIIQQLLQICYVVKWDIVSSDMLLIL